MGTDGGASRRMRKNRYSPEQVKDWLRSGLAKGSYARQKGIDPNVFARWIKRYDEDKVSSDCVRIEPPAKSPDHHGAIEIELPDGIRICCTRADEAVKIVQLIRGQ
jgi:transposase-like protein